MEKGSEPELDAVETLGLIAGNGRLPFQVVSEAGARGIKLIVAAIKEETDEDFECYARGFENVQLEWLGLGQLGRLIHLFQASGVTQAIMVGQVKHARIFAPGSKAPWNRLKHLPDWRMIKLLAAVEKRDTSSLIEGVIDILEQEGIVFLDSTLLLQELLAGRGVLTRRRPDPKERADIDYGRPLARKIAAMDLGQTLVVADRAVVAVEAMEGTDATIERAAALTGGRPLSVIKVSRPHQDMRFDVPVVGMKTLETMVNCRATALSVDAGRTLILEKNKFLRAADQAAIAIVAGGENEVA